MFAIKVVDFIRYSTEGMRKKRMHKFLRIMKPSSQEVILDIGGFPDLWGQCDYKGKIVFLNLEKPETYRAIPPNCSYIQGNGCCLNFPDKSFDIVFSNSVIEHVGDWENQKAFAHETSRVGKRYWIQTPNKYFPIEPHFIFPFFQFLPHSLRKLIAVFWPFSFPKRYGQKAKELEKTAQEIKLLKIGEMRALYPDGILWHEAPRPGL